MTTITQFDLEQMQSRLRLNVPEPKQKRVKGDEAVERELHEKIIEECRCRLWPYVHSRMDKPSTTGKGSPDFVIAANYGRTFWIECKSGNGKLSPEQRIFIAMARRVGVKIHVIESYAEFLDIANGPGS